MWLISPAKYQQSGSSLSGFLGVLIYLLERFKHWESSLCDMPWMFQTLHFTWRDMCLGDGPINPFHFLSVSHLKFSSPHQFAILFYSLKSPHENSSASQCEFLLLYKFLYAIFPNITHCCMFSSVTCASLYTHYLAADMNFRNWGNMTSKECLSFSLHIVLENTD